MHPFPEHIKSCRVMVFVDGENLTMRYADMVQGQPQAGHVEFERDVFVWSKLLNVEHHFHCDIIRRHFYTSAVGDPPRLRLMQERLKGLGIEAPRVFPRGKNRGSKRVDVTLAVEMLSHAHRRNYDAAVLATGDEDFVPLVEGVQAEGRRVFLWALQSGLSEALKNQADYFFDLRKVLLSPAPPEYT